MTIHVDPLEARETDRQREKFQSKPVVGVTLNHTRACAHTHTHTHTHTHLYDQAEGAYLMFRIKFSYPRGIGLDVRKIDGHHAEIPTRKNHFACACVCVCTNIMQI